MDIRCAICKEPTDNDELHYVAEEEGRTYREVYNDFVSNGCVAIYGGTPCEPAGNPLLGAAIYDLMGDDVDGAMSAWEDAEMMGLI